MNKIFNCCHGMFETQAGAWICSSHPSDPNRVDEEIIGDEGPGYKSTLGSGDASKLGRQGGRRGGPAMPVGGPGGPEDEKETAKQRLQRLIRDFAHDAVGPGLEVEAQCQVLAGMPSASSEGTLEALLRMDRRLSRIELWGTNAVEGSLQGKEALLKVPLQQVTAITKRIVNEMGDTSEAAASEAAAPEANTRNTATLVLSRRSSPSVSAPELRLTFESSIARDRAYTCLRIFQMSVDQSLEGQSREAESDATGYESSLTPSP